MRWQVEIDPFCLRILAARWPLVKRYGDVRAVAGPDLEPVDVIIGGFPCQDISIANTGPDAGLGLDGARSGLWRDFARVLSEARPRWVWLSRIAPNSLIEDWIACSPTLPDSGSMRNGQLFARPKWGPGIGESECPFVPTPTATDYKGGMVDPSRVSQFRHWVTTLTGLPYPHPSAVEGLMGFPIGWTELTRSETPSCQPSRAGSRNGSKLRKA